MPETFASRSASNRANGVVHEKKKKMILNAFVEMCA
jgi:hypothetical protein